MATLIWGIVFIVLGAIIRIFISRRQFYRRNEAGVEEFDGYGAALVSKSLETILGIGSLLLLFFGLIFVAGYFIFAR